jgi:hypothetical protein
MQITQPRVIDTPDGPVTQAPVESLEQTVSYEQGAAQELSNQIAHLQNEVLALQSRAGSILALHQKEWASSDRAARIAVAQGMEAIVTTLEESITQLQQQPHQGLGGFVRGLKDKHDIESLETKLRSAKTELDNGYRAVADELDPPTGVTEADTLLTQIKSNVAQASELTARQKDITDSTSRLKEEIARRKAAVATLGFDAPAVQADLIMNGLHPIQTSLVMKRDEIAVVQTPASLCRYRTRTQYVGGSQGISIPLGRGFRYRISGFRSTPVRVESLVNVDSGTLVVTNQRLVFLGSKKDVATPIAKLLQIEGFSNALGIGREGKESRDIYLLTHPAYIALYLQWVVSHQS